MTLFEVFLLFTGCCLCEGCGNVVQELYVNEKTDVRIQFTLLNVPTTQAVGYLVTLNDNITVLTVTYISGVPRIDDGAEDIEFIGNASKGEIWFHILHIDDARAGIYKFGRQSYQPLECQKVYILGKPTVWLSNTGANAEVGGNVIFSCRGTSTTTPSDHGFVFDYLWTFDGVPAEDSRFQFTTNKMTVTKITKLDQKKAVSCKVREKVVGGLTSDESNQNIINVNFGPEGIRFEPNDTIYKIVSGSHLQDITCRADCNPYCNFNWTKDGNPIPGQTGNTLSLFEVTRADIGKYSCTAFRKNNSLVKDLFIEVIYGPDSISVTPTSLKYSLEENSTLSPITCIAECWEECWYQWTGPVNLIQGAVLSLDKLNRKEDGVYTCTANNNKTSSTASIAVTIEVTYGPENIAFNPPVTTYINITGTKLADIVCTASCNPLCIYVWTKDGRYLPGQSGNTLSLGYLNSTKAGIYTCTASRSPYNLTRDIIVYVIYGPNEVVITPSKNNYTYNEGHLLNNILCSATCYPSCQYEWTKRSGSYSVDHGTLSLGNLTRQERGLYICIATNPSTQRQRTTQITVNVRYGPDKIILVPPTASHAVVEGDALQSITCSADECWPECTQAWINVTSGKAIGTGGTLSLGPSSRYYTGNYKCTSTNVSPEIQKKTDKSIIVNVSYFPVLNVVNETSIEVTEHNANISLLCLARGEPDRYTFFPWVQKAPDLETPVQEYKGVSMGNRNRLVLEHLSYMNSGLYICSVTNNITNYQTGESIATETLRVTVKGKPFVTESDSIVDGATGRHVTLDVSYFSNDDTNSFVTWFKIVNGTRSQLNISSGGKFREMSSDETVNVRYADVFVNQQGKKTQLEISKIAEGDFGYYEIEIVNSIGKLSHRLELVPRGPPSLPVNFTVVYNSETTTSITLIWFPGFHGGANQTFHIEYKTNLTQWAKGPIIPGGKSSNHVNATVNGLLSGTEYIFQLYSENLYGRKNVSIFTTGTTSEVKTAEDQAVSSYVGLIAGGAAGGVVLAVVIVVLAVLFLRRRKDYFKSQKKSLLKNKDRPAGTNGADDTEEINLNPMYESAGPLPSTSNNIDVYSQVDKSRKKAKPVGDIYSQVDNPKNRRNSEVKNDVYAQVQKKTHKGKDEGKFKPKKQKPDKTTKREKQTEGELYDNVDTINSTVAIGDTVYENPSCSIEDEQPKQMKNQDELVYALLDLPKETVGKDRKAIIHGLDDRTDYADIKYGEVGEQAPESDQENTNED